MASDTSQTKSSSQTEILYSYTTPRYVQREHSPVWYGIFGLISLILLSYAIFTQSPMMFVVFFLLTVLVILTLHNTPEEITVTITDEGIELSENEVYPYTMIKFFGILQDEEASFISLFLHEGMMRYIRIPLTGENPEDIANILEQFIERKDGQESLVDKLDTILHL